jgi:hypothetical protein
MIAVRAFMDLNFITAAACFSERDGMEWDDSIIALYSAEWVHRG